MSTAPARRRRVTAAADLLPWIRAQDLDDCFLYWMPLSGYPPSADQRQWLLRFFTRFTAHLQDLDLRSEVFLDFKALDQDALQHFLSYARQCSTVTGLARKPGAPLPPQPSPQALAAIVAQREPVDPKAWTADYCYWFTAKQPDRQRELFLGLGGMTTLFLPPDPAAAPPQVVITPALRAAHPAFAKFDVDARLQAGAALRDSFLQESKHIFGAGLEQEPSYPGLAFILPALETAHLFAAGAETRAQWFQLFDVYLRESPADRGLVLAFKKDYEAALVSSLEDLQREGMHFLPRGSHERP